MKQRSSITERLPQLKMMRPHLANLPPLKVTGGYALRTYQAGDERHWCRLVNECIGGSYTEEECRAQMEATPQFAPEDLFFATHGEGVVGTAWARRTAGQYGEGVGYVHMVGVLPEHRGRHLGRSLSAAVLHRFREIGYRAVILHTDDFRLAAIRTYLALGFRPVCEHESHAPRWRVVGEQLNLPEESYTVGCW